eukprot:Lankesteria_metandrocarpae@DN9727_c0_g1_i1.p1
MRHGHGFLEEGMSNQSLAFDKDARLALSELLRLRDNSREMVSASTNEQLYIGTSNETLRNNRFHSNFGNGDDFKKRVSYPIRGSSPDRSFPERSQIAEMLNFPTSEGENFNSSNSKRKLDFLESPVNARLHKKQEGAFSISGKGLPFFPSMQELQNCSYGQMSYRRQTPKHVEPNYARPTLSWRRKTESNGDTLFTEDHTLTSFLSPRHTTDHKQNRNITPRKQRGAHHQQYRY